MSAPSLARQAARLALIAGAIGLVLLGTREHWSPLLANAMVSGLSTAQDADKSGAIKTGAGTAESGATGAAKPTGGRTVPVIVDAVGETPDDVAIQAIGTARAARAVILYPEAGGRIVDLPVKSGQRVAAGDIILRLDDRSTALAVRVAETHVRDAERALDRSKALKKTNVRSTANVEDAEVSLERARLERFQAREALADRTLRAPFAGIIGIPAVEAGDRADPATAIASLDDRSTLLVEFEVAERYLARLADGMALMATTPAFPGRAVAGRIDGIDSRVDPVSRTVLVRAAFDNKDDALRPGMSFAVSLKLPGPLLPSVPELALQWRDGQSYLWRIRDGVSERVDVSARRRLNDRVLVEGEIRPGELVVIEGVQRLHHGRPVEITVGADG